MNVQVAGASVRGTGHKKHNIPCQDAHIYRTIDDYVVVCVADGLGSASLSHIGSAQAVEVALEAIQYQPPIDDADKAHKIMLDVFKQVNRRLQCLADENGSEIRDYATTLICVTLFANFVTVAHIGDGAVVVSHAGHLELISSPQNGEYVNEVTPVTSEKFIDSMQITFRSMDVECVAVFTDGLERLALDLREKKPFQPFFDPLFTAISNPVSDGDLSSGLEAFLNSDRVCERTDDDKTLVLIGKMRGRVSTELNNLKAEDDHISDNS